MNVSNFRGCLHLHPAPKFGSGNVLHKTRKGFLMKPFGAIPPWQDLFVSSYVSLTWGNRGVGKQSVMKKLIYSCAFAVGLAMGLSACTDPYDPGQRAIGGGLFGAGTGAAIGGIAGGGRGAATGALIGGALGAAGGAATTPSSSYYGYGSSGPGYYGRTYYGSGYNGSGYYGYGY
jgi:hypothetical protein